MTLSRLIHRSNSWSRMKITPEMFKTICTFDRITPRFLSIIFGLGRKTASIDEHYHHLSISTETKDDEVSCKDEDSSQERSRENQYESYGLPISLAQKSALELSSSIRLAEFFSKQPRQYIMPKKDAELLQIRRMLQYPPF